MSQIFHTVVLPVRPQPDTLVAIFLLKEYGESKFPGIKNAKIESLQVLSPGETHETHFNQGRILIDLGGGPFDHHSQKEKTTSSILVANHLEIIDDPALTKLLDYAKRDDFFGKGTVSEDHLDRAFGLSALVTALNKQHAKEPQRVVEIVLPLIEAHHKEEVLRTRELPKEFNEKMESGEVETFLVKQRDKKLNVVILNSDNGSMPGFLRSQLGGRFDVVAQWLSSGHVNILTRPAKRIDLRSLALLIRMEELRARGKEIINDTRYMTRGGRVEEVPDWYYDMATNSIQNGGINPKEINPTKITKENFSDILKLGLSEEVWSPMQPR